MEAQETVRKDGWTEENDHILVETVLSHIRNGSTQLAAFQEAAERLERTPAACGFRWNAEVRKRFEKEIRDAKKDRKESKNKPKQITNKATVTDQLESILRNTKDFTKTVLEMKRQNEELNKIIEEKDLEIAELKLRLEESKSQEEVLNEDYKNLIEILRRARQMGILDKIS
jgi:prespore-specific regulator